MPAKRRLRKQRGISDLEPAQRIFQTRGGFEMTASGAGIFTDAELADAFGCLPLIAYPDPSETLDNLRSADHVSR
jgi:hypothetical protein